MSTLSAVPRPLAALVAAAVLLGGEVCRDPAPAPVDTGTGPRVSVPADWMRFGYDAGRSNTFPDSTGITAGNVTSLVVQRIAIDGTVDASPIYLHGVAVGNAIHDVFFVTTTYGKTLAIDADSGAVLWRYTAPGYDQVAGSYRITTATPVADPDRQYIYAAGPDGRIRKLAVADGREVWSTAITLLPSREKIASALNWFGGRVIATTGGYIGDAPPYQGHVAVLDASTGAIVNVWNALCSDRSGLITPSTCAESGAAIWGRAGAVVDTTSGNILVATGDGLWNGSTHWGDAVIELDRDASRIVANYTPSNTTTLDQNDVDLGSTAPVLLGGTLVEGGKDGVLKLLDRASISGATPHEGSELQTLSTPNGVARFTAPAVQRRGGETWIFAADGGGTAALVLNGASLQPKWSNGNAGTSPVVAGGLLYVYDPGGGLRVYDPATGNRLTTLDCGSGHWNSPIIVDGRIALAEGNANGHQTTGVLDIWRVPR